MYSIIDPLSGKVVAEYTREDSVRKAIMKMTVKTAYMRVVRWNDGSIGGQCTALTFITR